MSWRLTFLLKYRGDSCLHLPQTPSHLVSCHRRSRDLCTHSLEEPRERGRHQIFTQLVISGANTETPQRNLIIRRHVSPLLESYVHVSFYFEALNHCLSEEVLQVLRAGWFGV